MHVVYIVHGVIILFYQMLYILMWVMSNFQVPLYPTPLVLEYYSETHNSTPSSLEKSPGFSQPTPSSDMGLVLYQSYLDMLKSCSTSSSSTYAYSFYFHFKPHFIENFCMHSSLSLFLAPKMFLESSTKYLLRDNPSGISHPLIYISQIVSKCNSYKTFD